MSVILSWEGMEFRLTFWATPSRSESEERPAAPAAMDASASARERESNRRSWELDSREKEVARRAAELSAKEKELETKESEFDKLPMQGMQRRRGSIS